MRAILVNNGFIEVVDKNEENYRMFCKGIIGDVPLRNVIIDRKDTFLLVVDDDGLCRQNFNINFLFKSEAYIGVVPIAGKALFTRVRHEYPHTENDRYVMEDVTDEDIEWVSELLSETKQKELAEEYMKMLE